jgi:hypothetical protein
MVQLTEELVELADGEALRRGVSRSVVIREALSGHFAESAESVMVRQIVDGYTRFPQATPDEWGSTEGQTEVAGQELLSRLDAEELAAGLGPW